VAAPSLAVFKARLDGALSNLVWWKMSLLMAGGWNQMILKVPSNPYHSMILISWPNSVMFSDRFKQPKAKRAPHTLPKHDDFSHFLKKKAFKFFSFVFRCYFFFPLKMYSKDKEPNNLPIRLFHLIYPIYLS